MGEEEDSLPRVVSTASGEASVSSGNQTTPVSVEPSKKKRNLPGMPDPEAEVIALSPKSLLATNRFVCEICNKGFQRDQNLQLHRRGHNLPWKLRQRTTKEVRKRVYVCPESSCVHHNPARALGDLTGIKKHFCRKHGEKKWKCERCSKKYAVQSDLKAHMKTCGTREYKCDCGTIFSRRDSFITHRAFCDALAEESGRVQTDTLIVGSDGNNNPNAKTVVSSPPPQPLTPSTSVMSPALSVQNSELPENPIGAMEKTSAAPASLTSTTITATSGSTSASGSSVFASIFALSTTTPVSPQPPSTSASSPFSNLNISTLSCTEPTSLSLSTSLYLSSNGGSFFPTPEEHRNYVPSPQPAAMSATALLQKAAQMGATSSNGSFLRGLGLATSSSSTGPDLSAREPNQDNGASVVAGLGIGLPSAGNSGFTDHLMMGSALPFGAQQPMTRDLLGLSIGIGGASTGGLSALLSSFGGGSTSGGFGTPSSAPYGGERGGGS